MRDFFTVGSPIRPEKVKLILTGWSFCWSRVPQLQEKLPFWWIDSFGEDIRDKVKIRRRSMFLAVDQSQEERVHPLHSRQRQKTGGLSYPHKGKRGNEAMELKTKDRKGSGTQYPWSAPGSMEDYREQWCDGKRLIQVHIH